MAIKYIAGDGTGDYDADGSDDQTIINYALAWAADNPDNQIHLTGPFTYDISDKLLIGSSTVLSGDLDAVLRLNDACLWAEGVPVIGQLGGAGTATHDVEIYGFELDLNQAHLYHTGTDRIHGKGFYNTFRFRGSAATPVTNIHIHDIYAHDGLGDGPRLEYVDGISVHDCRLYDLMHSSVFCVDCETIEIYDNDIKQITNAGVRFDNCRQGNIHGNHFTDWLGTTYAPKGGAHGIQIGNQPAEYGHTAITEDINIYNNYIQAGGCGIELEDYLQTAGSTPQNVHIYNNLLTNCGWVNWAVYFSGISLYKWGNGVTIEYNTIDNAYRAGILITSAITPGVTTNVRYNNIINTVQSGGEGGYGIWNKVPADFSVVAEYNYLTNNISGNYLNVTPVSELAEYLVTAVPVTPDDPGEPGDPDDPDEPVDYVVGSMGIMMPSADGHYIFQRLSQPGPGDKILLFPMPGSNYAMLKLATPTIGKKVIIVPDGTGKYYMIE